MTTTLGQEALDVDKAASDDLRLWSVTTIIDVLHKEGIVYWAAEMAAEAAIDNLATWQAMLEDRGRDETITWIRDARNRLPKTRLSDAKLGTVVHKMCETYALTGQKPDKDFAADLIIREGSATVDVDSELKLAGVMLNQFDDWLQRFTPSYQATEVAVFSPQWGFAGTADAFLTIDGTRFLADYKSTRKPRDKRGQPKTPYPEQNALQLAAYRHADFAAVWRPRRTKVWNRRYYLLSPAEIDMAVPVPEVDTGLVILITPESCEAYPMQCDEPVFESFLHCQDAFRWASQESKTVMGAPLQ